MSRIIPLLLAVGVVAGCHAPPPDQDDARMAQAMRRVEADQAKSDKLVMQRADAETLKAVRLQNAIRKR